MGTHYPGLGVREAISRQEEDKGEEKRVEGKGSVLIQMLSPARTKKANPDPNLKSSSVVRGGGREQTQIQLSIGGNGRTPPPSASMYLSLNRDGRVPRERFWSSQSSVWRTTRPVGSFES